MNFCAFLPAVILLNVLKLVIGNSNDYDCPWEFEYTYEDPITTVSFDQFRHSMDFDIKIKDNLGSTILSSTFVDRNTFRLKSGSSDSRCSSLEYSVRNYNQYSFCFRQKLSTWLKYLDLSNNKFEKIQSGTFTSVSECLFNILLNNNNLTEISDGAFNSLSDLKYLDISHNNLKEFNSFVLLGTEIEYLDLSFNNIKRFQNVGYSILSEIKGYIRHFDISHNNLHEFPIVTQLSVLAYLDISHNYLQSITINNCNNLQTLMLSNNKFENFNSDYLTGVPNLIILDLSHNQIVNFSCPNLFNIVKLNLSFNRIKNLQKDIFSKFEKLQQLSLSNNNLILQSDMFEMLPTLQYLYLDNNNFKNLPIQTFKNLHLLTILKLSKNKLHSFDYGSFSGLYNLQELDLSYNNIECIEFDKLLELNNLEILILDGNHCSEYDFDITDLNFKLDHLRTISLNDMAWSCERLAQTKIQLRKLNIQLRAFLIKDKPTFNINGIKCFPNITVPKTNEINNDKYTEENTILLTSSTILPEMQQFEKFDNYLTTENYKESDTLIFPVFKRNITDENLSKSENSITDLFFKQIENLIKNETYDIKTTLEHISNSTALILEKLEYSNGDEKNIS